MNSQWKYLKVAVAGMVAMTMSLCIVKQAEAAAGDLDTTFGSGGKVTTDFVGSVAKAIAVQLNGRIVIAGTAFDTQAGGQGFALARYDNGGNLDTTFGDGGKVVTTVFGNTPPTNHFTDSANAIVIQNNGSIVVAGPGSNPTTGLFDFTVLRYTNNGRLDPRFGNGGIVRTGFPGANAIANGMMLQPDGKIVVVGTVDNGFSDSDMAVVRYNGDGSLDTSFGQRGKVIIDLSGFDQARTVHLAPGGKILVGGQAFFSCSASPCSFTDFVLLRLNANGSLDTSFGVNGLVKTDFASMDGINALDVALDGTIIAAGFADRQCSGPGCPKFALARYNANGSPDTTFGTGGKLVTDIGSMDLIAGIAITAGTPTPKIVLGGSFRQTQFCAINTTPTQCDFMVLRYNWNGTLDTSFGNGGRVTTEFGNGTIDEAFGMAIDRNGQVVLVGSSNGAFAIARYLDGDCQQSFPPPIPLPQVGVGKCG